MVGVPSPTTDLLEVGGGTPTSREKYNNIACLNANGSLDESFEMDEGFSSEVLALHIHKNKLLVGGEFIKYDGEIRNRIARLVQKNLNK